MKDNSPSYIYKKEYLSDLLSISLLEKIEQLKNPHNSFGQNIPWIFRISPNSL